MDRITYLNKMLKRWDANIDYEIATNSLKNQLLNNIRDYLNVVHRYYGGSSDIIIYFYHLAGESTLNKDYIISKFYSYLEKANDSDLYYILLNYFYYASHEIVGNNNTYVILHNKSNEDILAAGSPIQIITDNGGAMMIVPAGAKELDDALVNDVLKWLTDYPKARDNLVNALKSFNSKNIKDCLNHMYKSLEWFLKEFFVNKKNIENQTENIAEFFNSTQANPHTKNIFGQIINFYKIFMNDYVRHGDGAVYEDIEFFLYQTGAMMRLLIQLKQSHS